MIGSNTSAGIFAYSNDTFSRIAEPGGAFFGGVVGYDLYLGPSGNGDIIFGTNAGGTGALLASPATCALDVTSRVKVSFGPVTRVAGNDQETQLAVVENTGGASIAGPVSISLYGLGSGISLANAGAGLTACTGLAPLGSPYAVVTVKAMAAGAKVTCKLTYDNAYEVTVSYTYKVFSGAVR